jgi:putative peptide zinc metalloprotease protein
MRRLLIACCSIVALTVGMSTPAGASSGHENIVHVENRVDQSVSTKARVAVVEDAGTTIDETNIAYSYASCVDCRTVTAAVQVVVVENPNVNDFQPGNAGVAVNESCTRCQTFAYANQVVLTPYRPVELDDATREQIRGVQDSIRDEVSSGHTFDVMSANLDALTSQLVAIVQGAIDRSGSGAPEQQNRDVEQQDG